MKLWWWGVWKGTSSSLIAFISTVPLSSVILLSPEQSHCRSTCDTTPAAPSYSSTFYSSTTSSSTTTTTTTTTTTALHYQLGSNDMTAPSNESATNVPMDSSSTSTSSSSTTTTGGGGGNTTTQVSLQSLLPPLPANSRRIYLLRHGETDWNKLGKIQGGGYDIPLNDNGKFQASRAAMELDGIPLDVIASSSLSRAKETADILHARHTSDGVSIRRIVDAGFNEMSFGEFEGFASRRNNENGVVVEKSLEVERFKDIARTVAKDPTVVFPGGGESTRQVEERSMAALYKVLNATTTTDTDGALNNNDNTVVMMMMPQQRHIAIVSHGRTNKVLIAATGLGDARRFQEVKQANVAINVMDLDDETGTWTIRVLNFINHVEGNVIVR